MRVNIPSTSAPPVQMVRVTTPQSRRWCGTIHFPTDHTQWADAAHCINTDPFTRFFICQPEICPTTETSRAVLSGVSVAQSFERGQGDIIG